jgi:hypothetical protein
VVWPTFPGRGVTDWGEGVVIDTEQGGVGDGNDPLVKNEPPMRGALVVGELVGEVRATVGGIYDNCFVCLSHCMGSRFASI